MQDDRERGLTAKFREIIEKIEAYNPYIVHSVTRSDSDVNPDKIEKIHPGIPKIIHYCWLSNDPIPEKLQECMKTWKEKLPDYEFMLWNFDRFDIDSSQWVRQAFDEKKYAFAADYIRLYAVYNYGGIYLDMDVEVVKPFDDLLDTDCMIAREDDNKRIRVEGGCFGAVKDHPYIRQCLEFYRNRTFYPEKMIAYCLPDLMGGILTAGFKDRITVFAPDYFTAKSFLTGIVTTTENTRAIHHFTGTWLSPEEQLRTKKRWEYYQPGKVSIANNLEQTTTNIVQNSKHSTQLQESLTNAIALLQHNGGLSEDAVFREAANRIHLAETYDKNRFSGGNNVFDEIYRHNDWGSQESRSGGGSELNSTIKLREFLPDIWKKYQIKTVLDTPCGDYNWMQLVDKTNITYIGGDIVSALIENNNSQYQAENVSFRVIDITKDELPKVDMIFCKDCLQHLSIENVWKALRNFKKSDSTWLLTTSYPLTLKNWDIRNGDYRPLNLFAEPFNLNNFMERFQESSGNGVEPDKMMFLYRLQDLKLELYDLTRLSPSKRLDISPGKMSSDCKCENSAIPVFFSSNVNYYKYTCVAIVSIILNNPDEQFEFTILTNDENVENREKILLLEKKYSNCTVRFIVVKDSLFDDLPRPSSYNSVQAFYRYIIPDIADNDKVIYLDSDVVCNGSIRELYDIDLADNYFGGVIDLKHNQDWHKRRFGLDVFINSGVLLMNCRKLRELEGGMLHNFKLIRKSILSSFWDNDALNILGKGKIKTIDGKYNWIFFDDWRLDMLKDPSEKPVIVHFAGIKPWVDTSVRTWKMNGTANPYAGVYNQYLQMSPYSEDTPRLHLINLSPPHTLQR
jgi:lipopolysaccharide biosynthesis glycosyltransferase/mannosyltransferase OCH1-like enzyme